ncbi:MAG TPA: peptidoglycan DD-metalloendopeptidase family protein [Cyclobacteriaceae bacterium]
MTIFLLKSSACIAFVYLAYVVFFKYTDKFQLNRVYLLTGLILSFVVPMIVLPATPVEIVTNVIDESYAEEDGAYLHDVITPIASNTSVMRSMYWVGVAVSLLISLRSMIKIMRLYWSGERSVVNKQTIVTNRDVQPFSFLGMLFIRSHTEDPIIIQHEMVHISQRHWIDLVLVEIASVILWFNPVIYLYRRSIALQHEYIADSKIAAKVSITKYLHCIARELESRVTAGPVSSFNTQSIKQRIIMITNSDRYSALRYAVVFPVVAIVVMAFATGESYETVPVQNKELRCPVDAGKLKSGEAVGFGKRIHPLTNKESFHNGVDFKLNTGSSVYAAATGTIVKAEVSGDYGNLIVIKHGQVLTTYYAHLERMLVKNGDRVEAGQLIGTVGSSGASTGPHLHFEVLKNHKPVDPVPYLDMWVD